MDNMNNTIININVGYGKEKSVVEFHDIKKIIIGKANDNGDILWVD